jgi:predicted HAD superfamily Cof-like phosphohydrolase
MSKTNFQQIIEFHQAFGLAYSPTISYDNLQNFKIASLRVKLIDEEFNELLSAPNLTEQLDAIGDMLYVIYGAGASFGFNMDEEYAIFCNLLIRSNQIPEDQYFEIETFQTTNYHKTAYVNYLINIQKQQKPELVNINQDNFFQNLIHDLSYNLLMCRFDNVKRNLLEMLYIIYTNGIFCQYDLDKLFDIIHKSNMTKLCKTEIEASVSVDYYVENQHDRYPEPFYKKSPDNIHYVLFERTTGKALKSKYFSPPNIIVEELIV